MHEEPRTGVGGDVDPRVPAASAPAARRADPWATFDRWAGNLLILLVALVVVLTLVVVPASNGSLGVTVSVLVAMGVTVGLLAVVIVGLRDGRSWARPAASALLYAMVAVGILEVVAGLATQRIVFPIAAILAVVVLAKRPAARAAVVGRDRWTAIIVAVAYLVAALPGPLSPFLAKSPSFLMAGEDDLLLGISTNCADPARITPGTDRPVVLVTWLWTGDDALPGGQEALQVEWDGLAPVELASDDLFVPDGLSDDPAGPAARALDAALDGSTPYIRYGMEGSSPASRQGTLRIPFDWSEGREYEPLGVVVRWAHDDAWMKRAATECEPEPTAGR